MTRFANRPLPTPPPRPLLSSEDLLFSGDQPRAIELEMPAVQDPAWVEALLLPPAIDWWLNIDEHDPFIDPSLFIDPWKGIMEGVRECARAFWER